MEEQGKSLSRWRFELQSIGKRHWPVFYKEFLGVPVSSFPRFYKALNNYGFWPMFEAIVSCADKEFESDPLNYVLKVAGNKWRESEEELQEEESYTANLEAAKERSKKANEELARKLGKIKK